jgi:large subunit ribosomal protein L21
MYAIVEAGGRQIKVSAGDTVTIELPPVAPGTGIVLDKVLALSKEGKAIFGRPYVEGAAVKGEVVSVGKLRKVLVMKHVPKKAHEKLTGHRQRAATVRITDIIGG